MCGGKAIAKQGRQREKWSSYFGAKFPEEKGLKAPGQESGVTTFSVKLGHRVCASLHRYFESTHFSTLKSGYLRLAYGRYLS